MHRILVSVALLAGALAGCRPDLPSEPKRDLPDLSGEWSYAATQVRLAGSTLEDECEIDGVRLDFGVWNADGLVGRSRGGEMRCTGELSRFSSPLLSYPIRQGGFVALESGMHFSFSLGSSDWRHEGQVSHQVVTTVVLGDTIRKVVFTDTLWGNFRLRYAGAEFQGKYRAVRNPRKP